MQEWIKYKGMKVYFELDNMDIRVQWIEVLSHVEYAKYLQSLGQVRYMHRELENDRDFVAAVVGYLTEHNGPRRSAGPYHNVEGPF